MENLVVAATASGRPGTVSVREDGSQRYAFSRATPRPDALLQAIAQRQSTRAAYGGKPVAVQDIEALQRAAAAPGVHAAILTERAQLNRVRDLVVAGNDAQLADAAFMAELKAWLRFSPRSAMATGDGLYAPASGNPAMPEALGGHAFDLFFTPSAEREKYARHIESSAGVAAPRDSRFAVTSASRGRAPSAERAPDGPSPSQPGAKSRPSERFRGVSMLKLNVNGRVHTLNVEPEMPLLWVLRDELKLMGTKYGCGIAQCGACTVHIDGQPVTCCRLKAGDAVGKKIVTIEGLSKSGLHRVQKAWIEHEVPQCGYCQAGQIMATVDLLKRKAQPSDNDIAQLTNLPERFARYRTKRDCRC